MSKAAREVVSQFPNRNIVVVGDAMLDEYVWGRVSRISPEAPVPVVEVRRTSYSAGGAANVAMNIARLGGKAYLAAVVGADETADKLKGLFLGDGVNIDGIKVDVGRPTTQKTRIVAHNQQVVRVDRELTEPIAEAIAQELLFYIEDIISSMDVILISDYAKGVTVPTLLGRVISLARVNGKPVLVDPKGRDFSKYMRATVITPNRLEAATAVNREIVDELSLVDAGWQLLRQTKAEAALITRGEEGMSLFEENRNVIHLPAVDRQVYDVTGAGDTVAGTFALALATGAKLSDCARIANCAAGIVVSKLGTATIGIDELNRGVEALVDDGTL